MMRVSSSGDSGPQTETISLLRSAELFSNLLDDDIAYIATRSERLHFLPGERLFGPGEKAKRFYVILSGVIAISKTLEGGRKVEMARFLEGDVLGDFDFAVGASYNAAATAESECDLMVFPSPNYTMHEIAMEKPDTAARILLRSLGMISGRLRSTHRLISENAPWIRELKKQIYSDSATGLMSRAFLDEEIPRYLAKPTALVFAKPDRFKELNDLYGHTAGDAAMTSLSKVLEAEIARFGRGWAVRLRSNETVLVIPSCKESEAVECARRLSHAMPNLDVSSVSNGAAFPFTMSGAIAIWPENGSDWKRLVENTYGLLTRAWRDGGNKIYRAKSHEASVSEETQ